MIMIKLENVSLRENVFIRPDRIESIREFSPSGSSIFDHSMVKPFGSESFIVNKTKAEIDELIKAAYENEKEEKAKKKLIQWKNSMELNSKAIEFWKAFNEWNNRKNNSDTKGEV